MKKLFLTALVAIVAIGGTFAGNGKSTTIELAGSLNDAVCNIKVECTINEPIPCRLDQSDASSPQLYKSNEMGKCTVYLGYVL